jgi:DNA-binding transcriptional regulator YhcF (GntR family)
MAAAVHFRVDPRSPRAPVAQIREQLITFAHVGLLGHGARLPSVRALAAQAGVNLKTAFRIYRILSDEGWVRIRPQHGVFLQATAAAAGRSYQSDLRAFFRRFLREAEQYNLSPARAAQLLAAQARVGSNTRLRCAVLECNREQAELFSREIKRKLGVDAFPVLTTAPPRRLERALGRADLFITTDFHREEVGRWAARHHKELYRIHLNPAFLRLLARNARCGPFPMVLTDISFEPRFRRVLARTVAPTVAERLLLVRSDDRARVRELLRRYRRAYVSPLCFDEVARIAPRGTRLLTLHSMISEDSLRAVRRSLGLASPGKRFRRAGSPFGSRSGSRAKAEGRP